MSFRSRRVLIIIESTQEHSHSLHHLVPVGPLGLVSFLESRGIRTDIVDLNVSARFPDHSGYDAVGFSVTNANIGPTLKRAGELKAASPGLRIFVGGPGALSDPGHLCRHPSIDAVMLGEAEATAYRYLRGADPGLVPGLALARPDGRVRFTGGPQHIQRLDTLPFPALDRVDLSLYDSPIRRRRPLSTIITSRGCPCECTFCLHSLGYHWRGRSPRHVVDEMEWQERKLGVQEIAVYDHNFAHDHRRVSGICREIRRRKLDVALQLPSGVRADDVSRELLRELRDAGFWLIGLFPESGNAATLRRIKKGFTLEQVRAAMGWCKELGFVTIASFILGFPWEAEREVDNTIRFAQEIDAHISQFVPLIPFPGTPLYEEASWEGSAYRDRGYFSRKAGGKADWQGLSRETSLKQALSRAYRSTALRPRNVLRLMGCLPPSSLITTTRFALATGLF